MKEEPVIGMIQFFGVAVATQGILKHDPKRNKLEYSEMKFG